MGVIEMLESTGASAPLITFIVAMTPVLELRGAIPLGVSLGMSHMGALAVAILGNMVPVPIILLFVRKVFSWLRLRSPRWQRAVSWMEARAEGKWDKVHRYRFLGLLILVAVPLPGTGAWTGSLVAALMDMRMRNALPAIFLGVVIAGILVSGITYGFTSIFA